MTIGEGPVPRRDFVWRVARAAGVAPAVLAFLDGTGQAFTRGEETDLSILYAALTIEHHAIALYDAGLRAGYFPPGLKGYAVEFRVEVVEARGDEGHGFARGYVRGKLTPKAGGEAVAVDDQFLAIAECEAGTWRVSRLMWSPR